MSDLSKIDIQQTPLLPNGEEGYPTDIRCRVRDFLGVMEFNFRSFVVAKERIFLLEAVYLAGVGFSALEKEGVFLSLWESGYKIQFVSLIFLRY